MMNNGKTIKEDGTHLFLFASASSEENRCVEMVHPCIQWGNEMAFNGAAEGLNKK